MSWPKLWEIFDNVKTALKYYVSFWGFRAKTLHGQRTNASHIYVEHFVVSGFKTEYSVQVLLSVEGGTVAYKYLNST